ncbi:MAG: hypothetical protein ACXVAD_04265 [Syntrophales bacterium]
MTEKARTTANQPGVGAIPHAKGVAFRVWAPHAEGLLLRRNRHWAVHSGNFFAG